MKNITAIIVLIFFSSAIKAQLIIGQPLKDGIKIIKKEKYILTSAGSIQKAKTVAFDGRSFDVTLDSNGFVKNVFTSDTTFVTENNIKIGMAFKDIKDNLLLQSYLYQPGWAKYYLAKDGWKIAFAFDSEITDTSRVQFIFK